MIRAVRRTAAKQPSNSLRCNNLLIAPAPAVSPSQPENDTLFSLMANVRPEHSRSHP